MRRILEFDHRVGQSIDSTRHALENPPFRIASLDATTLKSALGATAAGAELLPLTGNPVCGVDFYYLNS